jgi:hypothetical protein
MHSLSIGLIAALGLGGVFFTACMAPHAPATRLIAAEIRFAGVPVLRGSTSDDGEADVDGVWDYQRSQLVYTPEPAFAELAVAPGADECNLISAPRPPDRGARREPQVALDVSYGGEVTTFELLLVRVPGSPEPGQWRVAEAALERLFPYRSLSRREAALLKHPKRLK